MLAGAHTHQGLKGEFPEGWVSRDFPDLGFALAGLTKLYLAQNDLGGKLPDFTNMHRLQVCMCVCVCV